MKTFTDKKKTVAPRAVHGIFGDICTYTPWQIVENTKQCYVTFETGFRFLNTIRSFQLPIFKTGSAISDDNEQPEYERRKL